MGPPRPERAALAAQSRAAPPGKAAGLAFSCGQAPAYVDFAYFSTVIGMTSQVADVGITHSGMRLLVLLHGIVSFGFNLLVLALTINLVASALG